MTDRLSVRRYRMWLWLGGGIIALCLIGIVAFSIEYERPVSRERLPAAAHEFLAEYYPQQETALVKKEFEDMRVTYKVVFPDGTKLEFHRDGRWIKIDSKRRPIPAAVVPPQIIDYVDRNFPGATIREIEHKGRNYEVELDNSIEMKFDDRQFFLTDYDD